MKRLLILAMCLGIFTWTFGQNIETLRVEHAPYGISFNSPSPKEVLRIEKGDKVLTEKDVIEKTHIDFTKEHIMFILSGEIEIDGHTFLNDTCKRPIYYYANLDKVTLIDPVCSNEYERRECKVQGCKVIHLTEIPRLIFSSGNVGIGTGGAGIVPYNLHINN